jgi:pimeloyl-ACP methyl ester carboxylesterase
MDMEKTVALDPNRLAPIRSVLVAALAAANLGLAGGSLAQTAAAVANPYDAKGPLVTRGYSAGACTIFRPVELKPGSRVILWGNGTGTQPVNYQALLHQLASYGFVVGAANAPNAGTGAEMLGCLDYLTAENAREGSPYKDKLDLSKVGATGHSQGGGGALMTGRDPRIQVTAPIMPGGRSDGAGAAAQQHGPMLLLSAGLDNMAPPETSQKPVFDAATTPVTWLLERGSGHLTAMGDGGPYRAALTAWFLYTLQGDAKAGAMFTGDACGYCKGGNWAIQRKP